MAYTTESLEPTSIGSNLNKPSEFNLPVKEFVGYDLKSVKPPQQQTQQASASTTTEVASDSTPAEAPVPEVPQDEISLSPKLSALARKEQAQRTKEKQLAEKERSFSEKMADAEKYRKLTEKLSKKDYSAIDELGVAYEEIVKHELNKEALKNPEQERVKHLEERLEALQKAQEEKEVRDYEANQALWKQEILKTVKENDEFSTVRELGAEDIVLQHINDSFEEDGVELTVEKAAKEIEEALLQRAEKFASISKIKAKLSGNKVLGAPKSEIKTITQNMTTTPKTSPQSKPFHLMSEADQIQEAIRRVQASKLQR